MKITNNKGLPQNIVRIAEKGIYESNPNSFGVTTILKPVREIILSRRYENEIEVDVSDMIAQLFGTAFHKMMEENEVDDETVLKEQKVTYEIYPNKFLSGKFDRYDKKTFTLEDYKTSSTWKVENNDFEDYRLQGLMYAWLLLKNGILVENIKFYIFLKDFKSDKAGKNGYPEKAIYIKEFSVNSASLKEIENFIYSKFELITQNELKKDDDLLMCNEEERWNKGSKYAVMSVKQKNALRLFDDELDAINYQKEIGGDYIEKRNGYDLKCFRFCSARKFCPYMKEKEKEI